MAPSDSPRSTAAVVRPRGAWHGDVRDTVVLDFDARHRRRMMMSGTRGTRFLMDLAEATALRGGDALELDDGSLIEIVAAPEALAEISSADAATMMRVSWHLGNRHLPLQLAGSKLRIRRDHVIEAMIEGLGGRVRAIEAPFDPEGGAYAGHGRTHEHSNEASHHHD